MSEPNFAEILGNLIKSRGINQRWLADAANTTEATVSRYVNGIHKPGIDLVVDIAKALNVSTDYLLGLSTVPTSREETNREYRLLTTCYNKATDHERENVWFQFRDYLSDEERDFLQQKSKNTSAASTSSPKVTSYM